MSTVSRFLLLSLMSCLRFGLLLLSDRSSFTSSSLSIEVAIILLMLLELILCVEPFLAANNMVVYVVLRLKAAEIDVIFGELVPIELALGLRLEGAMGAEPHLSFVFLLILLLGAALVMLLVHMRDYKIIVRF